MASAKHVPDLSHSVIIEVLNPLKSTSPLIGTTPVIPIKQPVSAAPPQPTGPVPHVNAPPPARSLSLSNESILKLSKAGLSDSVIVGMIDSQPGEFALDSDSVIALKQGGVSDTVIAAILNKSRLAMPTQSIAGALSTKSAVPFDHPAPKIYVSDSNSWSVAGGFATSNGSGSGYVAGGARPQTVEVIKTFGQRCPAVTVTLERTKADYIVLFDREGGKGYAMKRDKIAIFKKDGDVLYSGSTRSVGNAVEDACAAIETQGLSR